MDILAIVRPSCKQFLKTMIHIVTALNCEARPIIAKFAMKGMSGRGPWRVFASRDARLIVSGAGKLRSALATQALAADADADSAILNIGCCGAVNPEQHAIGDAVLAHQIRDHGSGRSHYPDVLASPAFAESAIETWDRGVSHEDSPGAAVVDMEAFGFYEAASLSWPTHRIGVLKVVSDHLAPERCQPAIVEGLIAGRIAEFADYGRALLKLPLSSRCPLDEDVLARMAAVGEALKLSATQRQQLRDATVACDVRNPEKLAALILPEKPPTSKYERAQMLAALLQALNPRWSPS
ncbi:MAG: adenosylhomocysteine nucleosidase [Rhodothermales bacterium]